MQTDIGQTSCPSFSWSFLFKEVLLCFRPWLVSILFQVHSYVKWTCPINFFSMPFWFEVHKVNNKQAVTTLPPHKLPNSSVQSVIEALKITVHVLCHPCIHHGVQYQELAHDIPHPILVVPKALPFSQHCWHYLFCCGRSDRMYCIFSFQIYIQFHGSQQFI